MFCNLSWARTNICLFSFLNFFSCIQICLFCVLLSTFCFSFLRFILILIIFSGKIYSVLTFIFLFLSHHIPSFSLNFSSHFIFFHSFSLINFFLVFSTLSYFPLLLKQNNLSFTLPLLLNYLFFILWPNFKLVISIFSLSKVFISIFSLFSSQFNSIPIRVFSNYIWGGGLFHHDFALRVNIEKCNTCPWPKVHFFKA